MRRAPGIAAALALAACQVNVEGAQCSQPGTSAECPDGQACGNDRRCSERAAACARRCEVGDTRCTGATGTEAAETCTDADPVCGSWQVDPCASQGLRCVERGEAHACECNPNVTAEFSADPEGSPPGAPWYPTGVTEPVQCRFQRLGDALAAALAYGGPATVQVYGAGGAPVVFGSPIGESYPLDVPEGVTLRGAAAPAGETSILGNGASGASILRVAGTVERVRVENVSMTGIGVELSCGVAGAPTLRDVIVSAGAQQLAAGVTFATAPDACAALLERVDVSGATGAALDVAVPASGSITARGSLFHASGVGVQASGGVLRLEPDGTLRTEVTDNLGGGVLLDGMSVGADTIEATLANVVLARNGGTGLRISSIALASRLAMTSCDVYSNGTVSPTAYGVDGRTAGGILLSQLRLASFSMQGNKVYGNHGSVGADELAFESSDPWDLTTGGCSSPAPPPNAFGCLRDGSWAVSVWPGTVDAQSTIWPAIPPTGTVSPGVNTAGACNAWTAACP